ncbi:MAG TPA: DUF2267 domain-containing protein [Gemmataceae bacterium]|nr:DUF2267 domain-containing protein [Gemmataceae bacterium]
MSQTGIAAFDSTLQTTNVWLNEILDRMGWIDRHRAYHALRVVLHALRDRLTVEGATALAAQLPLLVRGIYYDGWHPADKPVKERKKEEFLAHVAQAFRDDPVDPEEVTRAVFGVLTRHVSGGEVAHLERLLPHEIRSLL